MPNHQGASIIPSAVAETGLTARQPLALILGWGASDEGKNQVSDARREGRGTASEEFYWRPVAPTSSTFHVNSLRENDMGRPQSHSALRFYLTAFQRYEVSSNPHIESFTGLIQGCSYDPSFARS